MMLIRRQQILILFVLRVLGAVKWHEVFVLLEINLLLPFPVWIDWILLCRFSSENCVC